MIMVFSFVWCVVNGVALNSTLFYNMIFLSFLVDTYSILFVSMLYSIMVRVHTGGKLDILHELKEIKNSIKPKE
jgi:hypothetical protein